MLTMKYSLNQQNLPAKALPISAGANRPRDVAQIEFSKVVFNFLIREMRGGEEESSNLIVQIF